MTAPDATSFFVRGASDFQYIALADIFQPILFQNIGFYEAHTIASVNDTTDWSHTLYSKSNEDKYFVIFTFEMLNVACFQEWQHILVQFVRIRFVSLRGSYFYCLLNLLSSIRGILCVASCLSASLNLLLCFPGDFSTISSLFVYLLQPRATTLIPSVISFLKGFGHFVVEVPSEARRWPNGHSGGSNTKYLIPDQTVAYIAACALYCINSY